MTERELDHRDLPDGRAAAPTRAALPMFTMFESSALVIAGVTLLLIYGALMEMSRSNGVSGGEIGLFIPHVILIALIVGGVRRVASILATFILLAACMVGLVACLDSLMHTHDAHGLGFAAVLQLPLFILCFRIARTPFSLGELAARGPRLALGVVLGVVGWYFSAAAVKRAGEPQRARVAATAAARLQEFARRDARAQVAAITSCLQRVPVTADSQPDFPVALLGLPPHECPEASRPAPGGFLLEYTTGEPDADGHRRSFHLVAHDEQMSDSARTFESDESMVLRDWNGRDARFPNGGGTNATEALASFGRCIEESRSRPDAAGRTTYPASLVALKEGGHCGYNKLSADSSASIISVSGGRYFVRYTPPRAPRPDDAPGGYSLSMEPERDSLGRSIGGPLLSFFSDTSGAIHMTRRGRAATGFDPVLPDCPGYPQRMNMGRVPICREWTPRQRWGTTSQLPTIGWSRSGSGTVGAGDTLFLIPQYQPVARSDSIVEAHIQWDAARPDSAIRRRTGRIGVPFGSGISIRLHHVYPDTGTKQIHFWIRTGAGEQYEFRDSVRVLLPSRHR